MDIEVKNTFGMVEFSSKDMLKDSMEYVVNKVYTSKCNFKFVNKTDNKTYFFKANMKISSHLGEVVGYIIANAMGIKNVKPIPALYKVNGRKVEGTLSLDFVENRQTDEVLNGRDLYWIYHTPFQTHCVENYLYYLKRYSKDVDDRIIVDENMELELLKLATFFLYSSQEDACSRNINFLIKPIGNGKARIELAPQCDNSFCCFIKTFTEQKIPEETTFDARYKAVEKMLKLTKANFQVKHFELLENYTRENLAMELAYEGLINPKFKEYLKSLEKINLYKEFEKYENENPDYYIPHKVKQVAYCIFEISKNSIKNYMETFEKDLNSTKTKIKEDELIK